MISRRLLRVKTLQIIYAYFQADDPSINQFEKELFYSINKAYDLYHYLFLLLIDVNNYAEARMEIARQKRIPSQEDLNPNQRFIRNKVVQQLRENETLESYLNYHKLSWADYPELIKKIYNLFIETDEYKSYMLSDDHSYQADKKLLISLLSDVILNCEDIEHILEEQSIFWTDDFEFMVSMVVKTISNFKIGDTQEKELMPLFKNEEDKEYVKKLYRKTVLNKVEYKGIIEKHTENWDVDRIAFLDTLIMMLAIAEILEFPSIPIKVTFDEYIEIAKHYSTEKSNTFINGILDKVVHTMRKEDRINKQGRGLIEESKR